MQKPVYFDHAATSWPKPPEVIEAVKQAMEMHAANPGRGSHQMAVQAARIIFQTRQRLASLFGIRDANHIFFSMNTSFALNQAIKGYVREHDHVVTTGIEHNSVRRPLEYLKRTKQIQLSYVRTGRDGQIDLQDMRQKVTDKTRLIVCTHSSNLLGTIVPLHDVMEIAREKKVAVLVDAAQTAGTYPIDVEQLEIDMLAFPGHKGLLGPQGTAGLYVRSGIELEPLLHGGTGSRSEEIDQPDVWPDRYETGTQNTPGIAGLGAGVAKILEEGTESIHQRESRLVQHLMEGLNDIPGVRVLGPPLGVERTGIASFVIEHLDASEVAFRLDKQYKVAVRAGYHCTPLAHRSADTEATGAVRASVGYYTTMDEVNYVVDAVKAIACPTS